MKRGVGALAPLVALLLALFEVVPAQAAAKVPAQERVACGVMHLNAPNTSKSAGLVVRSDWMPACQ